MATKKLLLRQMPEDVRAIIVTEQAKKKIECNCQFSMEQTIYMLLRKVKKAD